MLFMHFYSYTALLMRRINQPTNYAEQSPS